jgi:hypothetical protein
LRSARARFNPGYGPSSQPDAGDDAASALAPIYPYWHQREGFVEHNPPPA